MLKTLLVATLALLLGACASLNRLDNDVSTFGPWPAERKPGTYAFERLPSQQAQPERRQTLEGAARGALDAAGFRAAADPASAEYLVQLGARITDNDPWAHNGALFWRGGLGYGFGRGRWPGAWGGGWGPGWGPYSMWGPGDAGSGSYGGGSYERGSYEREVVLLIRDRKTGQLMYEARAVNTGVSGSIEALLPAMYQAAMKEFPGTGPNPRNVSVQLSTAP